MSAAEIAVNALSQVIGGGVSVATNLVAALASARPEARFTVFCSSEDVAGARYPGNVVVAYCPQCRHLIRRAIWEQTKFAWILRKKRFDVVLGLGGFSIFLSSVPQLSVWQNPNIHTRIKVRRSHSDEIKIFAQRIAQRYSMRKAELNVFLTQDSVSEAETRWAMDRIPHLVIHNGVAIDVPSGGRKTGDGSKDPFALAVGHSYFHKNYEALIDAIDSYRSMYGEGVRLLIAGGAVEVSYHQALEARIEEGNLRGLVRFLGPTPPEEVARLYGSALVYVTTSRLESFGITVLEAMAYGVPVLASRASCIPEVCGDAALYCDPDDPEDIARKLHQLWSDKQLRDELSRRGYERYGQFDWASRAQEYLIALDRCVANVELD
jgi:glycosyltransferase involved in cell wall biosynthesis